MTPAQVIALAGGPRKKGRQESGQAGDAQAFAKLMQSV